MKKLIVLAVFVVLFAAGSPVFAQKEQNKKDSEYYYVNVNVEKVYLCRNGYIVQYRKGAFQHEMVYLPIEWFSHSAGKAELITLPSGGTWPSLSVYYKNGEFSHVRLYVHRSQSHQTWGFPPQSTDIESHFENVDDLKLKF